MSIDSDSFFDYSDFSFVKEKPNTEELIDKNFIKIHFFNKTVTKNSKLEGYFKIIIPSKWEEGSFYLKLIGEEIKEIDQNIFNNKNYIDIIKEFKKEKIKSFNNSKIIKINSLKKENKDLGNFLWKNTYLNKKLNNKVQQINKNNFNSVNKINKNQNLSKINNVNIEKNYKIFSLNEEINKKSILILLFSLLITDEYNQTLNTDFELFEEDKIKLWEKLNQNFGKFNKLFFSKALNKINFNYRIKIYYLSDKASNYLEQNSKYDKIIKLNEMKNSNNYFESSKSFIILENLKNLKNKYDKFLNFKIQYKLPKFSFFCLNLIKYFDLEINLNRNVFYKNNLIWDIIIYYKKMNLKYYKFLDILIFSRYKNKIKNNYKDNILYLSSTNLKKEGKTNNNINQYIKKIDLKDIKNKVEYFETPEESYCYYLSFF